MWSALFICSLHPGCVILGGSEKRQYEVVSALDGKVMCVGTGSAGDYWPKEPPGEIISRCLKAIVDRGSQIQATGRERYPGRTQSLRSRQASSSTPTRQVRNGATPIDGTKIRGRYL